MALLAVFQWKPADRDRPGGLGDLEIIDVLPADEYPGRLVEENMPRRFMFVYISDRDFDDPGVVRFLDRQYGPPDQNGDRPVLSGRKWRGIKESIPGDPRRFLQYIPWDGDGADVPNNMKYTAAQFVNFMRDKNTE